MIKIIIVSILLAAVVLVVGMWYFEVGAFHHSVQTLR